MSEILDEYEEGAIKKFYKNRLIIRLFGVGVLVILFGVYVGDMLFGKSSLDVLLNLQEDKKQLQMRVLHLKKENSILQKEYFELRQLDPDSE